MIKPRASRERYYVKTVQRDEALVVAIDRNEYSCILRFKTLEGRNMQLFSCSYDRDKKGTEKIGELPANAPGDV